VEERLRQVNLGGRQSEQDLTREEIHIYGHRKAKRTDRLGLARAEYMMDPTQNNDVFVEVSGLLKTSAVNLSKIASDLRLLHQAPGQELGKSSFGDSGRIYNNAGKVNPVIPEAVNQIAFQIMGNDLTITLAANRVSLSQCVFTGDSHNLFEMLDLLKNGLNMLIGKCIKGIKADNERCSRLLEESFVSVTALLEHVGYEKAAEITKKCVSMRKTVKDIIIEEQIFESGRANQY
jgi:aspartate ammonia-lyase